jgi:ribosomal protein L29
MAKKNKEIKKNLKESTPADLAKNLVALQEDLRVLKFKAEGAKSKNVKEAKSLKRQIAQVLTEMNKSNTKR